MIWVKQHVAVIVAVVALILGPAGAAWANAASQNRYETNRQRILQNQLDTTQADLVLLQETIEQFGDAREEILKEVNNKLLILETRIDSMERRISESR